MDTNKVRELIAELESEIQIKTNAIRVLRSLIDSETVPQRSFPLVISLGDGLASPTDLASTSYMDLAVMAIEHNQGRPLHVKSILAFIRDAKGNQNIERRSVEATIIQHIRAKGETSRLIKTDPGTYALRRYPRTEPAA